MYSFLVMRNMRHLLPVLDRGRIFRARRVQLGMTLTDMVRKSGLSMALVRNVELKASADLSLVRKIAEHLELTQEQALAMHVIQHQEYRPAPGELKQLRSMLPTLDSGLIFRARRAQMGLSRDELAHRSGVATPLICALEMISGVDLDVVRDVAPHLEITPVQALCMLSVQRRRLIPECLRNLT